MTDKQKEAMKLALEALEESLGYVQEEAENAQRLYGQYPTRQARIQGLKDDARKHMDAITALRVALASQGEALASEAIEQPAQTQQELGFYGRAAARLSKRAKELEAQQQEPVALVDGAGKQLTLMQALDHAIKATEKTGSGRLNKVLVAAKQALAEQPAQPHLTELQKDAANLLFALHDAWPYVHQWCTIESSKQNIAHLMRKHGDFADLYAAHQPPKQWVGLTDEDIKEAEWLLSAIKQYEAYTLDELLTVGGVDAFARAIESKLREKNT